MKFVQHFPGYIDYEPKSFEFKNIQEVLDFEEVAWWSKQPGFYGYFGSVENPFTSTVKHYLMALYDYTPEFYGCKRWYVLGFISGNKSDGNLCDLLPIVEGKMGTHKITCCTRLFYSIQADHFFHMPKEIVNRICDDMKWDRKKPIAVCDCGWDDIVNHKNS